MYFNFILVFSHIKNIDDESNKVKWFRLNCFDVIVAFLHRGATYGKLKNDVQKSVFICKRSLYREHCHFQISWLLLLRKWKVAVVDQESRKKSPPNVENIFMVITRVAPHQTEIGKESEREKFNYLITFFRFRGDVCV